MAGSSSRKFASRNGWPFREWHRRKFRRPALPNGCRHLVAGSRPLAPRIDSELASFVARFTWDLHSALGFWSFLFVLMWGITGFYFAFPDLVNTVFYTFDPQDRFTNRSLYWLSNLHFGRFGLLAEAVWAVLGLIPALLAATGVFLCCRRIIYNSQSPEPDS